jgi:hypothetical protein
MRFQSHTTNPTSIKRIDQREVDISITYSGGKRESFTLHKLEFEKDGLPENANLWIVVYAGFTENRVHLGTIKEHKIPFSDKFSQMDNLKPLLFRVIISEPETEKIIASCEGFNARKDTEEEGSAPILPVEQDDLGERLWILQAGEEEQPVLIVNSDPELMMINKLEKDADPYYRALIIPEAINQALEHVARTETDADWRKAWVSFVVKLGKQSPDDLQSDIPNEISEWATDVVDAWLKTYPVRSQILLFESNDDN